jgi:hypothetical protein
MKGFSKIMGKMAKKVASVAKDKGAAPSAVKKSEAVSAPSISGKAKGIMGAIKNIGRRTATATAQSDKKGEEPNAKNLMNAMRRVGKFKMFKEGGSVRKRAAGSPPKGETRYEVLGRPVTKEQYDAASKEMDRPKSKVEEDMDDFAKQAKERMKMKPKKMMSGGMADKAGRAMKKTAADAKGRAMTKAPKKMMGGGMAKYAKGGQVACGPATRGYGAARKSK